MVDRQGVETALEMAAAEGWNPGLSDAEAFYAADPQGFLAVQSDGGIAGTIAAVVYGGSHAFLGLFIVKKEFRGRGIGRALWEAALRRTGALCTGLDAVTAMEGVYARHAFRAAYRSIRYLARSEAGAQRPGIVPLGRVPFAKIDAFDRTQFPGPRTMFLDAWVRTSGAHAFAALRDGKVEGYGLVRPCRSGWKIGPLFALSRSTAEDLLAALLASVPPGEDVSLDVPLANAAAAAIAVEHRMQPVFETVRMYRGGAPATEVSGVYGVTSFELG